MAPHYKLEKAAGGRVAGLDEVGRGPLAGPVIAAAVVFPNGVPRKLAKLLDDSKKLTPERRLAASMHCVVGGDALSLSIAAASIVAKVARDRLMTRLAARFPHYGWETNAGYGTPAHCQAMAASGISPHHRRGFAPVRAILQGTIVLPADMIAEVGTDPADDAANLGVPPVSDAQIVLASVAP